VDVRLKELAAHLERNLAPVYLIHGDEPLLAIEAGDAVRAAARRAGCDERETFFVEPGFRWDAFLAGNSTASLFGGRKLIDLRIPTGKPGVEGGKALEEFAARPNPDNILLVTLPRVDRATQSSAWFKSLAQAGAAIAVYPLSRNELPAWLEARLARQKQSASPETLAFLADRCEGNLLAARQEIEKLGLSLPEGRLAHDDVVRAVTDVARYDLNELSAAWLTGDAARAVRILASLEAEGEGAPLFVWQASEDLHALAAALEAVRSGSDVAAALRSARVWGKRSDAMALAARRVAPALVARLLRDLARIDALAKGIGRGNVWNELRSFALALAASPDRPAGAATGRG
jgi:DNA polymerase-3 subunit delta